MGVPRPSLRLKAHVSQAPGLGSQLPSPARGAVGTSLASQAVLRGKEGWAGWGGSQREQLETLGFTGHGREEERLSLLAQASYSRPLFLHL